MDGITDRERVLNTVTMRSVVQMFCPDIKINRQDRCPCPIHGGTHNSMRIYDDTNSFYCFACGTGGDPIRFVSELENVTYRQAIQEIAAAFGISTESKPTPDEIRQIKKIRKQHNAIAEITKKENAALEPLTEKLGELMTDIIRIKGTLQDIENISDTWEYTWEYHASLNSILDETIYDYECVEDEIAEIKEHYDKLRRRIRSDDVANNRPRQDGKRNVAKRKQSRT